MNELAEANSNSIYQIQLFQTSFPFYFRQIYSYDVYSPPDPPAPQDPSFHNYHVEQLVPLHVNEPNVIYGHVDRVVMQNKDCEEKKVHPKTDGCGACGNCPCNCHTRKPAGGRLSDLILFRYDIDKKSKGRVRKKRFLSKLKGDLSSNNQWPDDDTTLLQMSLLKKLPSIKKPVVDECGAYHYKSCGHRGPNCPECYNCTCVPIKDHPSLSLMDMDEYVSAALHPNFTIPDKYDPIMRQEVSYEPLQYTDQSPSDYQRLREILSHRSRMDPAYAGGFISPAPAQQTQEILKLLIDLMDNKQDVKAYKTSNTFHNPHDWMYVVNTDSFAYKIGQNKFMDILPLNQLEQQQKKVMFIDDRPRFGIQMPAREPSKPLYGKLDNVAELYKNFKEISPVPVNQLLKPVNKMFELQAKQQVENERQYQSFMQALKIKRETDTKSGSKDDQDVKSRPEKNQIEAIANLYKKYVQILNKLEKHEAALWPKTKKLVLTLEKANKNETTLMKVPPNHVVLKWDSGILLGEEQVEPSHVETDSETSGELEKEDNEFVSWRV